MEVAPEADVEVGGAQAGAEAGFEELRGASTAEGLPAHGRLKALEAATFRVARRNLAAPLESPAGTASNDANAIGSDSAWGRMLAGSKSSDILRMSSSCSASVRNELRRVVPRLRSRLHVSCGGKASSDFMVSKSLSQRVDEKARDLSSNKAFCC